MTLPSVKPLINDLDINKNKIMMGTVAMIIPAKSTVQLVDRASLKLYKPIGIVYNLLSSKKTMANKNSFQTNIAVIIDTVDNIGLLIGITIFVKVVKVVQPSMSAESSNSFGKSLKYVYIRKIAKGNRNAI